MLTQDPAIRNSLHLDVQPKIVYHSPTILYLGIPLTQDLKWNNLLVDNPCSLAKMLTKRVNAITKLRKFVSFKMIKQIASGIFMSKLHYGMELWAGAPNYL